MTDEEYQLLIANAKAKYADDQERLKKDRINQYRRVWYQKNKEERRRYCREYGRIWREKQKIIKNKDENLYTCSRCSKIMTIKNQPRHDKSKTCSETLK